MINCGKGLGIFFCFIYMNQNETKLMSKNAKMFYCEICDFTCSKKSNYNCHLLTRKHNMKQNETTIMPKNAEYICEICEIMFNSRSTLWRHKKKCTYKEHSQDTEITVEPTMEYLLMENLEMKKDNLEMKKMMIELCKKIEPSTITNNTNNSNNQNFNINIFLNEECKDAMNLTDFVDSIQLSIEDMLRIGNDGQTSGMSNILIDKLNALDVVKRPLHCSDTKKETLYVKDDDKWEKEERNNPKIKNALNSITNKTIKAMSCLENKPDEYLKTISEVLKEPREDNKIISDMAKEITV